MSLLEILAVKIIKKVLSNIKSPEYETRTTPRRADSQVYLLHTDGQHEIAVVWDRIFDISLFNQLCCYLTSPLRQW